MLEKELIAEKVTEDTAKKMKMRSGLVGSNPKVSSRNAGADPGFGQGGGPSF